MEITQEQSGELALLAKWLRARKAELLRQCSARKAAADCMRSTTAAELKGAARIAENRTSRKTKAMTVKQAKQMADRDSTIAGRLEAEAVYLSAWADLLEQLPGTPVNRDTAP